MLSAVIITKNEENCIERCIYSLLPVADEIVVVDSFSTDATEEICRRMGVVFIQHAWQGYAKQKNWANAQASYDFILSIDADEELSPELQKSILAIKQISTRHFYYSINRITGYCGRWIKYCGWFPDHKPRIFDRRKASWEGDFVHEKLSHEGDYKPLLLNGLLYHYSFESIEAHVAQTNRFSTLWAEDKAAKGKKGNLLLMLVKPPFKFFSVYFLKLGFLEGRYGFIIACISAYSRFLRQAKLWQLSRRPNY